MVHGDCEGKYWISAIQFELLTCKIADLLGLLILQIQNLLAEHASSVLGLTEDSLTVLVVIQGLF